MPFRFTFWRFVCAAAILAAASIPVEAGGTRRHVLLLYSYDREFANAAFSRVFQNSLSAGSAEPVDFIEVSLHTRPSAQRDPDDSIVDEIRTTSGGVPIDLVVPIGGPAAVFAQQYRDALFPSTPILLASVDDRFVGARTLPSNETAVTVRHDPPRMIETILRLLPETRTGRAVVIGAPPLTISSGCARSRRPSSHSSPV